MLPLRQRWAKISTRFWGHRLTVWACRAFLLAVVLVELWVLSGWVTMPDSCPKLTVRAWLARRV